MGSPSSVCNTSVVVKDLCEVWLLFLDQLLQLGDLAHLFERKDLVPFIAIYGKACGVVATVFESRKPFTASVDRHTVVY